MRRATALSRGLRELWRRASYLGVDERTPPTVAQYIVLVNVVTVIGIGIVFAYLLWDLTYELDWRLRLLPPIITLLLWPGTLWLNHRKHYWLATTWLLGTSLTIQLGLIVIYGPDAGNRYFLLALIAGIMLAYPPQHRRTANLFLAITLASFLLSVFSGAWPAPLAGLDAATTRTFHDLALVTAGVLITVVVYYSHRNVVLAQRQLEARTLELSRTVDELHATQAHVIETEKQAVLGRLVAGILHEMNTPLGTLRSALGTTSSALERCREVLAQHDGLGAEAGRARHAVEVMRELAPVQEASIARINAVVESLQRFVGLDQADTRMVDVRDSVESALTLLAPKLGDRVELRRDYPDTLPSIFCNPAKLSGTFYSLLENAVDAIDSRGCIEIRIAASDSGVTIEIADSGRGIPAQMMPELFELGFSRKGKRVGMRLGLPMCKRHVEEIGGEIQVQSREGDGTTVRLRLPRSRPGRFSR